MCLTYWRNAKESSVTEPLRMKGRLTRDKVKEIEQPGPKYVRPYKPQCV